MYKRKTVDGGTFNSDLSALLWIVSGKWVCIDGKPVSNGWIRSWSLSTILDRVRTGCMTKCCDAKTGLPYYG